MTQLSIIIPVSAQETACDQLADCLLALMGQQLDVEIIFCGKDKPPSLKQHEVCFVPLEQAPYNRANALNTGADQSSGDWLWFLHVDTDINQNNIQSLIQTLKNKTSGFYYFDLKLNTNQNKTLITNNLGVRLRSRLFKSPFGDQAFLLDKSTWHTIGPYNTQAEYGEDHLLTWQAREHGIDITPLGSTITSSARKYEKHGWVKTTLKHQYLWQKQAWPAFFKLIQTKHSGK